MDVNNLQIVMLGSFSVNIGEKAVLFKKNRDSKMTHLLQFLLHNYGKSIPIEKLIDVVYYEEEIENPVKALQVLITRLRQALLDAGLPKQDYIIYSGGMYGWNTKVPCTIDAIEFESTVKMAAINGQSDQKLKLYTRAIEIYCGDFLPNLAGNDWAMVVSTYYLNLYIQCFEKVKELLYEKGDYRSMLTLCSKGINIYPSEEKLHIIYINCLIEEGRLKEALSAYNSITEILLNEWCADPSEELQTLYTDISAKFKDAELPINQIRDELSEEISQSGAYYCSLMSFIDSYRYITRVMERSGQSAFLMLCNLTNTKGERPESGERFTYAAKCLYEAVKISLRRSDMYTRYSVTQFLILLVGASMENCAMVSERIVVNYKTLYKGRGIRLKYSVLPATEVIKGRETISFSDGMSVWK